MSAQAGSPAPLPARPSLGSSSSEQPGGSETRSDVASAALDSHRDYDARSTCAPRPDSRGGDSTLDGSLNASNAPAPVDARQALDAAARELRTLRVRAPCLPDDTEADSHDPLRWAAAGRRVPGAAALRGRSPTGDAPGPGGPPPAVDGLPRVRPLPGFDAPPPPPSPLRLRPRRSDGSQDGGDGPQRSESSAAMGGLPPSPKKRRAEGGMDGMPPGGGMGRRPSASAEPSPGAHAEGSGAREDGVALEGGGESAGRPGAVGVAVLGSFASSPATRRATSNSPLVRARASSFSATPADLALCADASASPSGALGTPVSIAASFSPGACSADRPSASPARASEPPTGQSVSLLSPARIDGSSLPGRRATATADAEPPATAPPAPQRAVEGRSAAARGGRSAGGSNVSWLERAFERIELNSDLLRSLDETESACGPGPGAERVAVAVGGRDLGEVQSGAAWPTRQGVAPADGAAGAGVPDDRGAARTAGRWWGDAKPGRWGLARGGPGDGAPPAAGRGASGPFPSAADDASLPWPRRSRSAMLQWRGDLAPGSPLLPRDPTLGSRLTAASLAVLRQRGDLDALVRAASRALAELWPQVERMARGDPLQAAGMATLALSLLAGDDDRGEGVDADGGGGSGIGMRRSSVEQDDQAAEAMARNVQRVVQRVLADLGGGAREEARCASNGSDAARAGGEGKARGKLGAADVVTHVGGAVGRAASAAERGHAAPLASPSPSSALPAAMERFPPRRATLDDSWGPAASDAASAQGGGPEGSFAAAVSPGHDGESGRRPAAAVSSDRIGGREGRSAAPISPEHGGERGGAVAFDVTASSMQDGEPGGDLGTGAAPAPLDLSVARSHASLTSTSRPSLGDLADDADDDDERAFHGRLAPPADSPSGAPSPGPVAGERAESKGETGDGAALGSATVGSAASGEVASVSLRGLRVRASASTARSAGSADDLRLHPSTLDTPTSRPSGPGGRPASRSSLCGKVDARSTADSESRGADGDEAEGPRRPARVRSARSPGASPLATPRGPRDDPSHAPRDCSPDSLVRLWPPRDGLAPGTSSLAPPRNSPASSPAPRASSPEVAHLGTSGGSRPAFSLRALHDALVSRDMDQGMERDAEEEEEEEKERTERRRGPWAEQSGESREAAAGPVEGGADARARAEAREAEGSGCDADAGAGLGENVGAQRLVGDSRARRSAEAEDSPPEGGVVAAPPAGALSSALASAVAPPTRDLFAEFASAGEGARGQTIVATSRDALERSLPELPASGSRHAPGEVAATPSPTPPGSGAHDTIDPPPAQAGRHVASVPREAASKGSVSIPIPAPHAQTLSLPGAVPRFPLEGVSPPLLGSASPVKRARSLTRGSAERARPKRGVAERDQVEAAPFGRALPSRPGGSPARTSFLGAGVTASPLREAGAPWHVVQGVEAGAGASDDGASSPDAPASAKRRPLTFRSDEEGGTVSWSGSLFAGRSDASGREASRDGRRARESERRSFDGLDPSALGSRAAGRAALGILASPAFDSIVLDLREGGEPRRKGSDANGGGGPAGRGEPAGRGHAVGAGAGRAGGDGEAGTRNEGGALGARDAAALVGRDGSASIPAPTSALSHPVSGQATSPALASATGGDVGASTQRGTATFADGRAPASLQPSANPFGFALASPPRGALPFSAPASTPLAPSPSSPSFAPLLVGEGSEGGRLAVATAAAPFSPSPTAPVGSPHGLHYSGLEQGTLPAPLLFSLAPPRVQLPAPSPGSLSAHPSPPSPFPLSSALRTPGSAARRRPRPESREGTREDRGEDAGGRGSADEAGARGGRKEPRQHTVSFSPVLVRSWHGAEAATGSGRALENAGSSGLPVENAVVHGLPTTNAAGSTPTYRDPPQSSTPARRDPSSSSTPTRRDPSSSSPLSSPLLTPSASGNFPSVGDKHAASSSSGAEGFKRARRDRGGRGDGPSRDGEAGAGRDGRSEPAVARRGRGSTGADLVSRPGVAPSVVPSSFCAAPTGPEGVFPTPPPQPEISEEVTLAPAAPGAFDLRRERAETGSYSSREGPEARASAEPVPPSGLAARSAREGPAALPEVASRDASETAYTTVTESWCSDLVCGDLSVHDVVSRYWPFLFEPPAGGEDEERQGAGAAQDRAPGPPAVRRRSPPPAPPRSDSGLGGPAPNSILGGLPPSHARAVEAVVEAVECLTRRAAAERGIGEGPSVPLEGTGETWRRGEGEGRARRDECGGWPAQNPPSDVLAARPALEGSSRRPEGGDALAARRPPTNPSDAYLTRPASPLVDGPTQAVLSLDPDAVRDLVGLAAAMALDDVLRARAQTQPWARLGRSARSERVSGSVERGEAPEGARSGSGEQEEPGVEAELSAVASRSLGASAKEAPSDPSHPEVSSAARPPRDAQAVRSAARPVSSLGGSNGGPRGSFGESEARFAGVSPGSVERAAASSADVAMGSVKHLPTACDPALPTLLDHPPSAPLSSPSQRASAPHDVSSLDGPSPLRIGALPAPAFARVLGSPSPPPSPTEPPTRAGSSTERHPRSRLRQQLPPGRLSRRSGKQRTRLVGAAVGDEDGEDGGDEREDGEDGEGDEDVEDLYALAAGTGSAEAGSGGEPAGEGAVAASPADRTGVPLYSPRAWGVEAGGGKADGSAFGASRGSARGATLADGAEGTAEAPATATGSAATMPDIVVWEVPSAPTTEVEDTEHDTSLSESRYRGRYAPAGRAAHLAAKLHAEAAAPPPPPDAATALSPSVAPSRSASADLEPRQAALPVGWSTAAFSLSSSPPAYSGAPMQHARARRRARFAGHLAPAQAHAPVRSLPIPFRAPVAFPSSSSPSPRSFDGLSAELHSVPSLSLLSVGLRSTGSSDVAEVSPMLDEAATAREGTRDDATAAAPAHLPPAPSAAFSLAPSVPTRGAQRRRSGASGDVDSLPMRTAPIVLAPARVDSPRDALPRPSSPVPLQGMPGARRVSPAPADAPPTSAATPPLHRSAHPPPPFVPRPISPPLASRYDAASPPPPHPAIPMPAPPRRARAASGTDARRSGASMQDLAGEALEGDAEADGGENDEDEEEEEEEGEEEGRRNR